VKTTAEGKGRKKLQKGGRGVRSRGPRCSIENPFRDPRKALGRTKDSLATHSNWGEGDHRNDANVPLPQGARGVTQGGLLLLQGARPKGREKAGRKEGKYSRTRLRPRERKTTMEQNQSLGMELEREKNIRIRPGDKDLPRNKES